MKRPGPRHATRWTQADGDTGALGLPARDHVQFDEVVADAGAGAEFDPITDFFTEGVQGVGGTQAVAGALRIFAACDVTAVGARFHCGFEFHATGKLRPGVEAVNDPANNGPIRFGHSLAGGLEAAAGLGKSGEDDLGES